jgi:hypothetical protein
MAFLTSPCCREPGIRRCAVQASQEPGCLDYVPQVGGHGHNHLRLIMTQVRKFGGENRSFVPDNVTPAATSPGRTQPAAGRWRIPWFPAAKDAAAGDGSQHVHSTPTHKGPQFVRVRETPLSQKNDWPGVFSIKSFVLLASLLEDCSGNESVGCLESSSLSTSQPNTKWRAWARRRGHQCYKQVEW